MGNAQTETPMMYIDQKKSRIRIYKRTLYMLGEPDFIQLLVNPASLTVAICPANQNDKLVHKIVWKKLRGKCSYELYSRVLIRSLQNICEGWEEGESYRLTGEMIPQENIVRFDLDKAVPSSGI